MPTLHKNITASADIHNPKWFPDANNGDVAWRNEKGELESTDELVLPAALNFVNASVAPPTTNDGDIYVLSSGGSVDAGWGAVSLDDWVRYDLANTTWNSITPQKSTLCYNETDDFLYSYDGTDWAVVGKSIYTSSGTVPSSVVVTLTDTLTFDGGSVYIDNSNVVLGNNVGGNQYTLQVNQLSGKNYIFGVNNLSNDPIFNVNSNGEITAFSTTASVIGSEKISLQNRTLVQGAGTAGTNIAFEVYDSDTTPNSRFEVRSNGDIYTNSNQGLSATYTFGGGTTGDIASMTFTNGILTSVTTVP